MNIESTSQLTNILNQTSLDRIDNYLLKYGTINSPVDIFNAQMENEKISSARIVANCEGYITKSYVYDILNGTKKNPSRDIVLIMALSSHMNRKITRRLLEVFGHRDLYAKEPRDIIIATCINHKIFQIEDVNEQLTLHHCDTFLIH